jgi:hypothetical protein
MIFIGVMIFMLAILVADALYARRSLRQRAAIQPQRPAWNLTNPSGGGWHPVDQDPRDADWPNAEDSPDLSRLFGQGRR